MENNASSRKLWKVVEESQLTPSIYVQTLQCPISSQSMLHKVVNEEEMKLTKLLKNYNNEGC
jgi:hypothetical protein